MGLQDIQDRVDKEEFQAGIANGQIKLMAEVQDPNGVVKETVYWDNTSQLMIHVPAAKEREKA